MAQTVRGCCLRKFSISYCPPHDLFQSTDSQVITGKFIRKQDATGTTFLKPVLCKDIQTTLGDDIFAKYALRDAGITRNVLIDREGKIVKLTRLYNEEEFASLVQQINEMLK